MFLNFPLEYQQSCTNEQFLMSGGGQGDVDRIFIFGINQSLQPFSQSQSQFKVCSEIFFQIYTIHAQINERILPCIYALLRLFREFEKHIGNSSANILIDSEQIALNSVHQVYLDIELKRMLLPFLIKYMKAHSKPWSTEPLLRR